MMFGVLAVECSSSGSLGYIYVWTWENGGLIRREMGKMCLVLQ